MADHDDYRTAQLNQETQLWRIAMSLVAVCLLGLFAACGYGCSVVNGVYQDTMNKCINNGGTFISKGTPDGMCLMIGATKHE